MSGLGNFMRGKSLGFAIWKGNKDFLSKYPNDDNERSNKFEIAINGNLKSEDRFMLELNFVKSECYIYYNDKKLNSVIKCDFKYIIPVATLYFCGEIVEVTKYEFM